MTKPLWDSNAAFFVMRAQPFTQGHKLMVDELLAEGRPVIIALFDMPFDKNNPLSPYERRQLIHSIYGDRVETIVIPPFGLFCYGRTVGFKFRQFPAIKGASATSVRDAHMVVWLTGNSGAGKSTLANNIKHRLYAVVLEGDRMRESISLGAGYDLDERLRHAQNIARLAKVLSEQMNVVIASIGATNTIRAAVEEVVKPVWVYVHRTQANRPDYPYEPPEFPDITVNHDALNPEAAANYVMTKLSERIFNQ